ncbi:Gfo/Idh/MocA family oxidoreductase [Paenibacillus sp. RC67]|uniref:Gfo/Idh/MocA family protein n=1 Tax=Paenibacillus sp. RC67 TaxID=3039392 RepID=UPI0024AE33CE|nr:Gfo/Idh/MocA family oxidoreductase [Paenibacillus sp. RC67]
MQKQRLILIGHGGISKSYLKAFSKVPNAEIVGVVGRHAEKVEAFAGEFSIPFFGKKLGEVAKNAGATAVIICTPNAVHYQNVMEASRLGLHCLCEKPLHISPEKQQEMIASCKEYGVKLTVSYMRRFASHLQYIKNIIDSGKLGQITVVDVGLKYFRPKEYYYNSWHGTHELDGGGPFIQQGSHIIDLALWLCGGYKEVITAKMFQVYHDIQTEDHGYAIIHYQNGAIGMIETSTSCFGLKKEGIEISGTKGTIFANYSEIVTFDVPGLDPPIFSENAPTNESLFERLVVDFVQSIEEDRSPFIQGESAKTTTELITDIYYKAGEPIRSF